MDRIARGTDDSANARGATVYPSYSGIGNQDPEGIEARHQGRPTQCKAIGGLGTEPLVAPAGAISVTHSQ